MTRNAGMVKMVDRGFTLQETGDHFGVTRERVRQIYKKITGNPTPLAGTRDKHSITVRKFWAKCQVNEQGCWIWRGPINSVTGYGGALKRDGSQYAHRAAYQMVKGPIGAGLTIDHLCRVTACVNPAHLEAVTQRENTLRSPIAIAAINARKTHCPQGHPYSTENTYHSLSKKGGRSCRKCKRIQGAAARYRRNVA